MQLRYLKASYLTYVKTLSPLIVILTGPWLMQRGLAALPPKPHTFLDSGDLYSGIYTKCLHIRIPEYITCL